MTSELDMFNSNTQNISKKSIDFSQSNDTKSSLKNVKSNDSSDLKQIINSQTNPVNEKSLP